MKREQNELETILSDPKICAVILQKLLANPKAVEDLMKEFIGQIDQNLWADPGFQKRLSQGMMENASFRGLMMKEIVSRWYRVP